MKRDHIKRISQNAFVRGGALVTIANFSASFLNYLFNSLSAKSLGPDGYSEIGALFAYVNVISIPLVVISTIIIRRLGFAGNKRENVSMVLEKWFRQKLRRLSPLIILCAGMLMLLPNITNLTLPSRVTLLALIILNAIGTVYFAFFQGMQRFVDYSKALILNALMKCFGAVAAFSGLVQQKLLWMYAFTLAGAAVPILYGMVRFPKSFTISKSDTYTFDKRIREVVFRKDVVVTMLSLLGVTILSNVDVVVAKKILSAQQAGLYTAWSLLAKIVLYFLGPLSTLSLIFFSAKETKKHRRKALVSMLILLLVVGLGMYTTYTLLGTYVIQIIFNNSFTELLPYLGYAAIFGFLYTCITLLNNYYLAIKHSASLIVTTAIPFYILGLTFYVRSLETFMKLNISISIILTILYLLPLVFENKMRRANL